MEEKVKKITLELTDRQLSYLFGAIRLGVWLEDWCAGLSQTAVDTYDTHSFRWCMPILWILEDMKKQSGFSEEWKGNGESDYAIELIEKFVEKECKKNRSEWKKYSI
jgi:hypothetical protein